MKAARVLKYGPPDVIQCMDVPRPDPGDGQLRVRVKAAGVGPWDALIREGKSGIVQTLPLTLGSDVAGIVDAMGANAAGFQLGEEVFGVTNKQFTGGYAEYAIVSAAMMARKPKSLNFIEAASTRDLEYVRSLGANVVVDFRHARFEDAAPAVDVVIDTVGGETRERSMRVLKQGGILVSVVSTPMPDDASLKNGARAVFFLADVTGARLNEIAELFDRRKLSPQVGTVLPLESARVAHEMLAGAPHDRGKIVLNVAV
jgi:NADPH:quinone reductase-like Zn-dependent oxidoreductase